MNIWKNPFEKELENEREKMRKDLNIPEMPTKDGHQPESQQKRPRKGDIRY